MSRDQAIERALDKIDEYLKETIILIRSFISNLCLISAAVASFSMPLFLLSFINKYFLFIGIALLSFVIIVGCFLLKKELEDENNRLLEEREALLKQDINKCNNLLAQIEIRKGRKDYTLDIMVYVLSLGVIFVLLAIIL